MPVAERIERRVRHPDREQAHLGHADRPARRRRARRCDVTPLAAALDRAAAEVGVDFIGGFSALVHKGIGDGRRAPHRLDPAGARDHRARLRLGERRHDARRHQHGRGRCAWRRRSRRPPRRPPTATASAARSSWSSPTWSRTTRSWRARSTAPASRTRSSTSASPGPGVVRAVVDVAAAGRRPHRGRRGDQGHRRSRSRASASSSPARRRAGSASRWASSTSRSRPRPPRATRVADILEAMGVERCGGPGTTAALALLNDAVKKGGAMGTSSDRRPVGRVHPRLRGRRA